MEDRFFIIHGEEDVFRPVQYLLESIKNEIKDRGLIVFLNGELGSGKTFFVKEFAYEIDIESNVKSPTFTLMKNYNVDSENYPEIYKMVHIDAYRLEPHHKETLRVEDFISEPGTIVFVEWPTAIDLDISICFANINFKVINENLRNIEIKFTENLSKI